jgi:peptide/nickel transport system permease protein
MSAWRRARRARFLSRAECAILFGVRDGGADGCFALARIRPGSLHGVAATALMSVNYIVWFVAGQYVFAFRLEWFPIWGFEFWRMRAVLIGNRPRTRRDVRFYRTVMLEEVGRDYVKTAMAKGVGTGGVLFRHVLKNALPPIITNVSLSLPFLFTGSLLLESFFGIPGLGGLSVNAINSSDMAVV